MSISSNLEHIREDIPNGVQLVAVSKYKPASDIQEAYNCGQRIFGENKVQELVEKHEVLPKDLAWHFIGHLQTNKVKYIAPFVSLIHSVDSFKLLKQINKEAAKNNRVINCLLQVYIASEETKYGLSKDDCRKMLSSQEFKMMKNISIIGLMGMATNTTDNDQVRSEFASLSKFHNELKQDVFANTDTFKELSIGMSNDYHIAITCGSTMIRLGNAIFGKRN